MRTSVNDPPGPDVATAAEDVRRSSVLISGSSSRSTRCSSMIVTLAGVRASLSGARDAVMTIWLVSMGNAGMKFLLSTNMSSRRDAPRPGGLTHAPRLDPAEETDDGPRQVPDFAEASAYSCGHSAGF